MPTKPIVWDDYFIPGTETLRNKLGDDVHPHGEPDPDRLKRAEEALTANRIQELVAHPVEGAFDYEHMKAIHRHIFQDVYDWAGEERVGGAMFKDGHMYYPAASIAADAKKQYDALAREDHLRGLPLDAFLDRFAEYWGELNVIHSFREGNTRTQFVFFTELARHAGYDLDPEPFRPGQPLRDEFVKARYHSQQTGSNERLRAVLAKAVKPLERTAPATALPEPSADPARTAPADRAAKARASVEAFKKKHPSRNKGHTR